jgi:tetratricopeptide (TPR) repeat protein
MNGARCIPREGIRFGARFGALGTALLLAATLSPGAPALARAQSYYIPHPPQPDSTLNPEEVRDPRVAPRDAHNPYAKDPHVPKNEQKVWANRDYYDIGIEEQATYLIPIVENGHLGLKTNLRGFWPRYNEGNLTVALTELKYVLWVFPNHPRALLLLGMLSKQLKDPTIPIAYYEKALHLFPNRAATRAQYGAYLVDLGERAQGILQLEQALKIDPSLLTARAWLDKARRGQAVTTGAVGESAPAPKESAPASQEPPATRGYVPHR